MTSHTAGIIIIGDEILKGQVRDTNSHFLCKRLHSLGVEVCKISVVSDNVDEIAAEVAAFSHKYDKVFTSGGIGPTHDDVTYLGIAQAFKQSVKVNEEFAKVFVHLDDLDDINDVDATPALKMAQVPQTSIVIYPEKGKTLTEFNIPIVKIQNVFILPGIPQYFEQIVASMEYALKNPSGDKFHTRILYINSSELNILRVLNLAVEKFKGSVVFGSYPELGKKTYMTKITLESKSCWHVEEAERYLCKELPTGTIVEPMEEAVYDAAKDSTKEGLSSSVSSAIKVIEECYKKFKPSEVFLSFNGGKDCTALLHLTQAVLQKKFPSLNEPLEAIYIQPEDPFPQVEEFILDSIERYNLRLKTIPGPIKHALGIILTEKPQMKAVLMGTRKTDPYSATLKPFQMTDEGWPQVMRVSPILDWTYQDVWTYLRDLSVPYCTLYDEGYTSLGGRHNTEPNPALSYKNADGVVKYRPAYTLQDGATERNGRL